MSNDIIQTPLKINIFFFISVCCVVTYCFWKLSSGKKQKSCTKRIPLVADGGLYDRPWHDAQAIARARAITRANQEKGSLRGWWKARPNIKLRELISPAQNSQIRAKLSGIYFNWYNKINLKFILLTLLFKSLFF